MCFESQEVTVVALIVCTAGTYNLLQRVTKYDAYVSHLFSHYILHTLKNTHTHPHTLDTLTHTLIIN